MARRSPEPSVTFERRNDEEILIATDGSASAHEAVGVASNWQRSTVPRVKFIHKVLPVDDYLVAGRLGPTLRKPHKVEMDESELRCATRPMWRMPPASPTRSSASRV